MDSARLRHAVAASIIVGVTASALVACASTGPEEPASPTPTASSNSEAVPEPSETPNNEEVAQDESIDAAKDLYTEYQAAVDAALNDGGGVEAFKDLRPYLGSKEITVWWRSITEQFEELGLKRIGEREVVAIDVVEYVGDPLDDETQEITFEVCLDNSDVMSVRSDGSPATGAESPDRKFDDVVMRRQPDGRWTVLSDETREPWKEC